MDDPRDEAEPKAFDVTTWADGLRRGESDAIAELTPRVYDELRRLAERCFARERRGHTLQPTALVHEAYLHLAQSEELHWESRAHFLAIAARSMRRVLVDSARRRGAQRRGGDLRRVTLDEPLTADGRLEIDVLALSEALDALGERYERHARVVELRFFGGLEVMETAHVLGVSKSTIMSDWRFARAWLGRHLGTAGDV